MKNDFDCNNLIKRLDVHEEERTITMKVTKRDGNQLDLYQIKGESLNCLIFIESRLNLLVIHSNIRSYSHSWCCIGEETFKEFLIGMEPDYLLSKIAERNYFDLGKVVKELRHEIVELRKENGISKERARGLYNDVDNIANEIDFYRIVDSNRELFDIVWDSEISFKSYDPAVYYFAHTIFPLFGDYLKEEVKKS